MTALEVHRSRLVPVTAAVLLVIALASLLVLRIVAQEPPGDGQAAAHVPPPRQLDAASLEVPCWSCPEAGSWPLLFRTDLDLLAPLGSGTRNAGELLAPFEKERGSRADEAEAFMARRRSVDNRPDLGEVAPADDPLLLASEPLADQARMWFYPDIFPMEGAATRVPNLLLALSLARSWIARGVQATDAKAGLEDCRRAVRLGRLLRQEDVVLINDLVGLACIHIGTRGIFEIAQRIGDRDLALLASIVLGEVAPQRLYTSKRIAEVDVSPFVSKGSDGSYHVDLPEDRFETLLETLTSSPHRLIRGEATLGAHAVLYYGSPDHRARARVALESIASSDDIPFASLAAWALRPQPDDDLMLSHPPKAFGAHEN